MKSILHSERLTAAVNATGDTATPSGFETLVGAAAANLMQIYELKFNAQFDNEPTDGVITLQVKAGSDVIHSETLAASGAKQVRIDASKITNAGTQLTLNVNVSTADTGTATSVDIDAQIYAEQWLSVSNQCG